MFQVRDLEEKANLAGYEIELDAKPLKYTVTLSAQREKRKFTGIAEQSSYGIYSNEDLYLRALKQAINMLEAYEGRNS